MLNTFIHVLCNWLKKMIKKTALGMTSTHVVLLVIFLLCPDRCSPWPCTEERLVYSNISFRSNVMVSGADLSYKYDDPILIQHPCEAYYHGGHTPPAIYLGNKVFFSKDGFQSSLLPLTIPNKMVTAPAEVTSAVFVQDNRMLLVVNEQVYVYFYGTWKTWIMSEGLDTPVTDITNIDCCYSRKDRTCWEVSRTIIAYKPGDPADVTDVYFSKNGGYSFGRITIAPSSNKLVSIYNFVSLSQLAVLLNMTRSYGKSAYFTYGGAAYMENREGSKFCLEPCTNETVGSLIPPGLRGFIVLWTKDTFLFSFNNGLTIDSITVQPTEKYSNKSLPLHGNGLCNVAANKNEIAALTKNLKLFYGMLDMEFTKMVHIGERDSGNTCEVMMFEKVGVLVIIKPVPSKDSAYYHFQKCIINIQDTLMSLRPPLEPCPVEILSGNFHNKMYYIDMKQELHFNVTFVPKPGTGTYPYVTVSNPHVLAFQADLKEDGYTFNGNAKYRLDIRLLQQIFSGMAHSQFQDDMYSGRLSTITVDIYNKGIFCIDMHPLTALIAVDCPPKKEIRIAKSTTACSRGLFKDVMLQSNYTYSINWDLYDPMFLGRKSLVQGKLNVTYNYNHWGCPLLLYYDSPWLPVLELWDNDEFVEYVSADFVLFEINGMHNYDYLLDEVEANCMSQAQNWTTLIEKDPEGNPHFAWSRYLYESCKEPRGNDSLPSASSKYQVLNRNENNRVLFPQYNGIYVFKAIVVDTVYSYCELSTVFSVYVHGALPKSEINVGKTLVSFLVLIFGSVLMVYYFPKLMKENARMKTVWT